MIPSLLTFDIFGTVVDWRRGLMEAAGFSDESLFDRIIDVQAAEEAESFRPYRELVASSLVRVLGLPSDEARRIGADVGRWPLFKDSQEGLRRLMRAVPCVAMTNSDRAHGEQVQERLGFRLSDWICAEDVGMYKPAEGFWHAVARRRNLSFGPHWWHVSAYADYDLDVAGRLGLTTVHVPRPHARAGRATLEIDDLIRLAELLGPTQAPAEPCR